MKKQYLLIIIMCLAVVFISADSHQYSSQPPFNYTGAEGSTCAQCHANFNIGGGGIITSGLPNGYFNAGQQYNFSVSLSHPSIRGRWGFSIDARDANNVPVGTFSSTNPNAAPNANELSHFMAVFQSSNSFTYNNLKWTAPLNPTPAQKNITFYYIGNAANGDGGSSGDFIYSDTIKTIINPVNQPPAISITSPANNASFPAGSTIALNANATDADGSVKKVEFYNSGIKFAEDTTLPFGISGGNVEAGNYVLTAKATDNIGATTVSDTVRITVTSCTGSGAISAYGFTNITGTQVADLTSNPAYPNNPSITAQLNSFEYSSVGDNYGGRLRGYICAPQTGNYTFYIAGDDQAGLFLSTNADSANKVLIAYNVNPVGFRAWTATATQKSAPVALVKGARYYIETLHKQSSGTNHLSVRWVMPNGVSEAPIPGNRLSPFTNTVGGRQAPGYVTEMRAVQQTPDAVNGLSVKVQPNPSHNDFNLVIRSNREETISIKVIDASGRIVEQLSGVNANSSLRLGNKFKAGIYLAEVLQGLQRKMVKLVKQ